MKQHILIFIFLFLTLLSLSGQESSKKIISLKVFPLNYDLYVGQQAQKPFETIGNIKNYLIPPKVEKIYLRSPNYHDKYIFFKDLPENNLIEIKLEKIGTSLLYQDILETGSQPKSVEFSGNSKFIAVALLNGRGVEIYFIDNMELYKTLSPPAPWSEKKGFVETVFFTNRNELWVSQMTTGMIHVFDTGTWKYKLSFDSGGSWPKVITLNKNEDTAYISNWESKNISVIRTSDYSLIKTIPVNGVPRGMAISPEQDFLYVCNFTSGDINKIDLEKNTLIKNIDLGDGALRHVVLSEKKDKLYISDMYHGTVSILDIKTDTVEKSFYAGSNVNTIKLSADEKKLFISSRGRNNVEGYLQKGPEFGKIYLYDTVLNKITDWTWGGNQPTGLAVSSDGSTVAFSDFLDHRVEIYHVSP